MQKHAEFGRDPKTCMGALQTGVLWDPRDS